MRAAPPKPPNLTSRFRIRAFYVLSFNKSGELDLLGREDIQRKKMREAMIILGTEGVEDGIVRDAEVSPKQVDDDIRVCHPGRLYGDMDNGGRMGTKRSGAMTQAFEELGKLLRGVGP
jgi:hypothetical protein